MYVLLVLLLAPSQAFCGFSPFSTEVDVVTILARCVATAAVKFFEKEGVITYLLPQNGTDPFIHSLTAFNRELMNILFSTKRWSLLVYTPKKQQNSRRRGRRTLGKISDNYIIVVNSEKDIYFGLDYLYFARMLNPFAKFFIISTRSRKEFVGDIQHILKRLWSYNILSGVLLFPNDNFGDIFDVYSWNPFADGKCGDDVSEIYLVGICNSTVLRRRDNWFSDKIPNNLNACPIKVRTIVTPPFVMDYVEKVANTTDEYIFKDGIDIQILNLVAEVANFTVHYSMSGKSDDYGFFGPQFRPNGTNPRTMTFGWADSKNASTGILDMLRKTEVDIGIGSMSLSLNAPDLEVSIPYMQDALVYCVPHSTEKPHWKKLLVIINPKAWFGTLFTAVLTFIAVRTIARRYKDERSTFKKSWDVGFILLQICTANIIKTQPIKSRVRMYLMLWIIFSLYFDTVYQTSLMSTLTGVDYESQINTQEEILKSDLDVLFLESSMQYFRTWSGDTPEMHALRERWQVCHNLHECLGRTAFDRDSAVATSRLYTSFEVRNYINLRGQPLLNCFKDNIISFPIVMYMRGGFPLKEKINKIIYMINSAGFVNFWTSNIFRTKLITEYKVGCPREANLTFDHIIPVFVIVLFGNMLSFLVFLAEIIVYKYQRRNLIRQKNGKEKSKLK